MDQHFIVPKESVSESTAEGEKKLYAQQTDTLCANWVSHGAFKLVQPNGRVSWEQNIGHFVTTLIGPI